MCGLNWCITCKFYRPPRSAHCTQCNRCVERYDHHSFIGCVGRRNYCYFFLLLIFLSLHLLFVSALALTFTLTTNNPILSPSNLCAYVLMFICTLLAVPILGLTGFHIILVLRERTTNEHVNGKFCLGFNPFYTGFYSNFIRAFCASQYPNFNQEKERKNGMHLTVSYFPEYHTSDGHNKEIMNEKSGIRITPFVQLSLNTSTKSNTEG
uniref:Palmitoyltransferase n=1 Tax=Panagrolaimus davidi TaxID=227884 RepID=A0A914QMW2_9BILA